MSPFRLTVSSALSFLVLIAIVLSAAAVPAAAGEILVVDLRSDPFVAGATGPVMAEEGPGSGRFHFQPQGSPAYPGDSRGSLLASFDSTLPSTRAATPLPAIYTEADDFLFGAVFSIRSDAFFADPFGFHPVTFALVNSATTGFDRTGDLSDFRADTFDSLEFSWFPQVSPFFGGPFLSPAIFGSPEGDDAFLNFAFGSAELDLVRDTTFLATVEHVAADRELIITLYTLGQGGKPSPYPGGRLAVDISGLTGFAVDSLAIGAYEDGFNIFSSTGQSLRADVDFHRLFFAEGLLGDHVNLRSLLARTTGRVSPARTTAPGRTGDSGGRFGEGSGSVSRKDRQSLRSGESGR